MVYTVKQLSKKAGVSIRTLHYYDEIGLLKPSFVKDNGYRYYEEKELLKLQQILFFRELEFPLEEISKIINSPDFSEQEALLEQSKLLKIKKARLEGLLTTIDKTLKSLKGGEDMNNSDLFSSFGNDELIKNIKQAKQRWGDTAEFKQSIERTKLWTKRDYERIKEESSLLAQQLAKAMDLDITSPQVQNLIAKHHKGIEYFYDCSFEMYRNLADLYVSDPRFATYYDKFRPGLAKWLKKAINYYCDLG